MFHQPLLDPDFPVLELDFFVDDEVFACLVLAFVPKFLLSFIPLDRTLGRGDPPEPLVLLMVFTSLISK